MRTTAAALLVLVACAPALALDFEGDVNFEGAVEPADPAASISVRFWRDGLAEPVELSLHGHGNGDYSASDTLVWDGYTHAEVFGSWFELTETPEFLNSAGVGHFQFEYDESGITYAHLIDPDTFEGWSTVGPSSVASPIPTPGGAGAAFPFLLALASARRSCRRWSTRSAR